MPNASRVRLIDEDFSYQALGAMTGVSGYIGTFERGPIGTVSEVITSAVELRRRYGGFGTNNLDYLLAERILNRGGNLRILNLRHYSDPTDPSTLTAVKGGSQSILGPAPDSDVILTITPKYAGAAYNNLRAVVADASNGLTTQGYFDLTLFLEGDEFYTTETYTNLRVEQGTGWADEIMGRSILVDISYGSDNPATGIVPEKTTLTWAASTGANGGAVVPTDIIGNSAAKTGFYAFDGITDIYELAAPNISSTAVHTAGATYAQSRQDVEYLAHLDYSGGVNGIISARAAITVDSKYYSVYSGGIKILHPITGQQIEVSEVADVMGISQYVANEQFPWIATDNYTKGFIPNAVGVGLNLSYDDLNLLAQRQVNMVVAERGLIYLKGNYSGQFSFSKASWRNVVKLIIYTKKSIKPMVERYLGEPNEFTTWKQIYNEVKPFLQDLEANRAVYPDGWDWQGDQYATKLSELQINNVTDLDAGKYRVRLSLNPIPGINEIDIYIAINSAGVEFTDAA